MIAALLSGQPLRAAGVKALKVPNLDRRVGAAVARRPPASRARVHQEPQRMAGLGELVYYEGGREAALALDPWFVPIDHTIIGIVDANPASGLTRGDRE